MNSKNYVPRFEIPKEDNLYYKRTENGGYNPAIYGSPKKRGIPEVLPNCVGYALGRFSEIIGKYYCPLPSCDAKYYGEIAAQRGYELSQTPHTGDIIVFSEPYYFGHVAVVEIVIDQHTVITSESSYNGKAFYNKIRSANNKNAWSSSDSRLKFECFIRNPAINGNPFDVDHNGRINVSDCTTALKQIAANNLDFPDINGDGVINASDVTALLKIITSLNG